MSREKLDRGEEGGLGRYMGLVLYYHYLRWSRIEFRKGRTYDTLVEFGVQRPSKRRPKNV